MTRILKYVFFALSFLPFIISCEKKIIKKSKQGVLHSTINVYDSNLKSTKNLTELPGEFKIWFKDSFIIEEIKFTKISSNNDETKINRLVHHYTFIDLKNGVYYDYKSFTDAAALMRKYSRYDKDFVFGLDFYNSIKVKLNSPLQVIDDTTINKIFYKRYRASFKSLDTTVSIPTMAIVYCRPDLDSFLLDSRRGLDIKVPFPITRIDYLPTKINPSVISYEAKIVADTLSFFELKVFNAWEKNAKEHPLIPK
jgi:hypothetical protein